MVWASRVVMATVGLAALGGADEAAFRWMKERSLALPPATWSADPDLIYRLNPNNPDSPGSFREKSREGSGRGAFGSSASEDRPRTGTASGPTTRGPPPWSVPWVSRASRPMSSTQVCRDMAAIRVSLRYRRDIASLDADVVLIYEGWNRTGALVDPAGFVPYATPPSGASWGRRMSSLLARHSLLLQTWLTREQSRRQKEPADRWSPDPYHGVFVSDVTALVRDAQSRGQTPVLILYPALYYAGMSPAEAERVLRAPLGRAVLPSRDAR